MRSLMTTLLVFAFCIACSGSKKEAPPAPQKGEACTKGSGIGPSTKGNCADGLICSPIKKVCVDEAGLRNELR